MSWRMATSSVLVGTGAFEGGLRHDGTPRDFRVVLAQFGRVAAGMGTLTVEGDWQADNAKVAARQCAHHVHRLQLFCFRQFGDVVAAGVAIGAAVGAVAVSTCYPVPPPYYPTPCPCYPP